MSDPTHRPETDQRPGSDASEDRAAILVHASAVLLSGKGILLIGPSGSGKSDLALRLIDGGAVLIADDQVYLSLAEDRLLARPPTRLAGLIELRGMGIMRVPFNTGSLDLVVDLLPPDTSVEPLPEPANASWLGAEVPRIGIEAGAASAVARIKMALRGERAF